MLRESEIELQPTGVIAVTPHYTYARYVSDFTERVSDLVDAQKRFKVQHNPTTLEFQKTEVIVEHEGAEVIYPVLVWDVNWVHGHEAAKIPNFREAEGDRIPTYPMSEYDELIIKE